VLATLTLVAQLTAAVPLPSAPVLTDDVVSSTAMVTAPRSTGRAARLLLQGSAGMAAGLLLGLIGMESGLAGLVPYDTLYPTRPEVRIEGLRGGFGLGAGVGVYAAGYALDGEGSAIGMALGMGVGATTALLIATFIPELAALASVTLPLAGALAGYELGNSQARRRLPLRPSFSVWNGYIKIGVTADL
jgi:hypothetical protein